jgi:hypothetical protein
MKARKRFLEVQLCFVWTSALDRGGYSTPGTDPVINGGAISLGVRRSQTEYDHSPSCHVEAENG